MKKLFIEGWTRKDYPPILVDNQLKILGLLKSLWLGRGVILSMIFFFVVLGVLIALLSPERFQSRVVILPHSESSDRSLGGLGGLANLAGVDLGGMMIGSSSELSPMLYSDVVYSTPFIIQLINSSFFFPEENDTMTYIDWMRNDSVAGIGKTIVKYTVKLPWTVKELISSPVEQVPSSWIQDSTSFILIDEITSQFVDRIKEDVSVVLNEDNGLVSITVNSHDALLSAQLTERVQQMLEDYIVEYKTSQSRLNLEFIEEQYREKRSEFETVRAELFEYRDANRNRVSERDDFRHQLLQDKYSLTQMLNNNLAEQVEQAKISVSRDTPVFSVIEPVKVPIERFSPKRSRIVLTSILLGAIMGVLVLLGFRVGYLVRDRW
ncbi:Wzz/FepE/Etk N-terminal domain-containing protein [Geofilum rubicundum]|nr:Wzz/FepE/Etk N-terminal domain-containing protein [Geofilum rubicundum]